MKIKSLLSIVTLTLSFSLHAQDKSSGDRGHGGDFTEQDIYLAMHEIGSELNHLRKFSFGVEGPKVLKELEEDQFLVVLTEKKLIDWKTKKEKEALSFAPSEITFPFHEAFGITTEETSLRIIIVNKPAWEKRLSSGKPIKNLVAHELWRAMGVNDDNYRSSSKYLMKLDEISKNPTAYVCSVGGSVNGYGATVLSAFEDLKRNWIAANHQVTAGWSSKTMCEINF